MKIILVIALCVQSVESGGLDEFLPHSFSSGTQTHNFNVTNSGLPHLPKIDGFMGTHGTFRFLSIIEQTAWLIGEPKHGLWRIQENGLIREYRKKGRIGLRPSTDPNDPNMSTEDIDIVRLNYAHYIPQESWEGYKYPDDRISNGDGEYDDQKDYLNFIDLSIYHPKYNGRYQKHEPIELPMFYCTMTQHDYPYIWNSWKFAVAQPMANEIGPLGIRAGIDIKENYVNALRFDLVHDGGIWVNVGKEGADKNNLKITSLNDHAQNLNYQRVNFNEMNAEVYLVERPFFNKPHLFIIAVMENKVGPSDYSYIRKDGPYWTELKTRKTTATRNKINGIVNHYPFARVENYPVKGDNSKRKMYGLPVYGSHHPNRKAHGMTGGACPERGGDWARYPWSNSGSGFPTNYEEITPLCDAVVVDMKLAVNLWVNDWKDPAVGLANAAYKKHVVDYSVDKNVYGRYTDPYLLRTNATNPSMMDLTDDGKVVEKDEKSKQKRAIIQLNFTNMGTMIEYNKIQVRSNLPQDTSAKPSVTCPPAKVIPDNAKTPEWGNSILVIVCIVLVLLIVELAIILIVCNISKRKLEEMIRRDNIPIEEGVKNTTFIDGQEQGEM